MIRHLFITGCMLVFAITVSGQDTTSATTTSIAKGLNMYVFPAQNQDQATQDADETACYKWAMEQTG